jgi:hypothetical protein
LNARHKLADVLEQLGISAGSSIKETFAEKINLLVSTHVITGNGKCIQFFHQTRNLQHSSMPIFQLSSCIGDDEEGNKQIIKNILSIHT